VGAASAAAYPQQRPTQQLARTDNRDRHHQHETQEQHLKLRQRRDTRENSENQQQPVVAQAHPPDQQPDHQQPLHGLEGVGGQPVTGKRGPRVRCLCGGREPLCAAIASELSGDQTGDHHGTRGREHRGQAQHHN
jgi:hypothetical protein